MKPGIVAWSELSPIDGNVLVVLNSAAGDRAAAAALFVALEPHLASPGALHVVAERSWTAQLAERGIPTERVLVCADHEGRDVELNYFLESPAALLWAVEKRFAVIVGSDSHDLHNERVNDIFERRALLLLGDGVVLAHTLPNPYLYVFDTSHLLERSGRAAKVRIYERRSRALVDDLHRLWVANGRPPRGDSQGFDDVVEVLTRQLGAPLLAYDEKGPIPLPLVPLTAAFAEVVGHLRAVVQEHDRQLKVWADAYAERKEAADVREAGITLRDGIIDDLRLQLEPFHRKLRRRWKEKRVKGPS